MCLVVVSTFVSKQEAFEIIHYQPVNSDFLMVSFWMGFILFIFLAPSLQGAVLITQRARSLSFSGRYSEVVPHRHNVMTMEFQRFG